MVEQRYHEEFEVVAGTGSGLSPAGGQMGSARAAMVSTKQAGGAGSPAQAATRTPKKSTLAGKTPQSKSGQRRRKGF